MNKLAIIGTGISGLGAAYLLHRAYDITVYEQADYAGGHARTRDLSIDGVNIAVDTGFIVFNYRNYPLLTGLFSHLDVPIAPSDMSLGLSLEGGAFEWGCQGLRAVLAQPTNALKPRFWRMIRDILRFNREAASHVQGDDGEMTLGELLAQLDMGADFRHRYLLPMAGAIWSASPDQILSFPASALIQFFHNHGLLSLHDQPPWYTVSGGSREYVRRVTAPFATRLRLRTPVTRVVRETDAVRITTADGAQARYDGVIFATHSDQALKLLATPTEAEQRILGAIPYQANRAFLHSDVRLMPRRRACWSSWNYLCDTASDERVRITVSYWMNRLQPLPGRTQLFVSLNPPVPPDPALTYEEHVFEHPVYSPDMLHAQQQLHLLQGQDRLWFCGAYQRYGFHEDGLASAVAVAAQLGCEVPWPSPTP